MAASIRVLASRAMMALLAGWGLWGCSLELSPIFCQRNAEGLCEDDSDPVEGCVCPAVVDPVCGDDGETYGNACSAECAGAEVVHEGDCEEPCICPALYDPVCGEDGETYGNRCEASCRGVEVAKRGECDEPCICPAVVDPVCGTDGQTYDNACQAACAGVKVADKGACSECIEDAECPHGYCERHYMCLAIGCPPAPPNRCVVCGDGTQLGCRALPQPCPEGLVREIVDGCYGRCVDRRTCEPPEPVCEYGGTTYTAGDRFVAVDGCNTCTCGPDGLVACTERACLCNYDDPVRSWVAQSSEPCQTVRFACEDGQQPFFDACGCGCEPAPKPEACRVGGCSGQLCVGPGDPDVSTCEFLPEYACYRSATCELQASGACGWTRTAELKACLDAGGLPE